MGKKETNGDKVVPIKGRPAGEHPRELLLEKGPETLSNVALIAILLKTGRQGDTSVVLAREMLSELGGFRGLMSATREDLLKIKGLGKAGAASILAAMEIAKRQFRQTFKELNLVQNPNDLFDYLMLSMANLKREEFRLLHLDRSKHLIAEEVLFKGTSDISAVYPREIVESALRKNASTLILAHNHPTGLPEANEKDISFTRALVLACWSVDIPILDHIIVGRGGFMSMKRYYPDIFEGEDEIA